MWEDIEKGVFRNYKRIKSILKFNFIESVLAKNIDQHQKNRNLELLAIKSEHKPDNLYNINLIFSGNSILLFKHIFLLFVYLFVYKNSKLILNN